MAEDFTALVTQALAHTLAHSRPPSLEFRLIGSRLSPSTAVRLIGSRRFPSTDYAARRLLPTVQQSVLAQRP